MQPPSGKFKRCIPDPKPANVCAVKSLSSDEPGPSTSRRPHTRLSAINQLLSALTQLPLLGISVKDLEDRIHAVTTATAQVNRALFQQGRAINDLVAHMSDSQNCRSLPASYVEEFLSEHFGDD